MASLANRIVQYQGRSYQILPRSRVYGCVWAKEVGRTFTTLIPITSVLTPAEIVALSN